MSTYLDRIEQREDGRPGPERICILVTGSRKLESTAHFWAIQTVLAKHRARHAIVLHGDQRGADRIAKDIARDLGFDVLGVPYFGSDSGGGHARNMCLIELARVLEGYGYHVVVYGFPVRTSRGTYGCLELAKAAGFECHELLQED